MLFYTKAERVRKGSFLRCLGWFGREGIAGAEVAVQEFANHGQARSGSRSAMFGFKMATHRTARLYFRIFFVRYCHRRDLLTRLTFVKRDELQE